MKKIALVLLLLSLMSCNGGGGGAGSVATDTSNGSSGSGSSSSGGSGSSGSSGGTALVEGTDTKYPTTVALFTTYAEQYAASVTHINSKLLTNYTVWSATTWPFAYKDTGYGIVSGAYIECKTYPDGTHNILVGNGWEVYDDTNTLSGYAGVSTRKAMLANFVYTAIAKCVNGIYDAGINTTGGTSTLANTYRNPANNIIYYASTITADSGVLMCLNQVGSYAGNRLSNLFINYPASGYTRAFIASLLTGSTRALEIAETEINHYNADQISGGISADSYNSYPNNTTLRADHWVYLQGYINR